MSIRQRIMILIVLTFIAIFSIGGYAIFQARVNASQVKVVTESVVPSALASSDLVSELKQSQLAAMTLVYAPSKDIAVLSQEKLATRKKQLEAALDFQLKYASTDAQRGLVKQAKESMVNYFTSIDESAQFKLGDQQDLAEANLYANVAQYQAELESIVETLRVEKNRAKDDAITALNANLSKTATGTSIFTATTVIILSIIGILLYRRIVMPIKQMQEAMSQIAASQDFSHQVPVERMDEIGRSIVAFNMMIAKIQESSSLLKQKTNDIQTMLQNMPQGILTVVAGNKIHPEYSAYLETIFETNNIVDRTLMDLVFANTNLGADALSQIEAVAGACIGEDVMNFEFNQHLMVGEIEKTMPDGRVKILDLNWSPITDDQDTIIRLMLCVRDVTELRKLAAEASKQKRELEIIGEILAVSQEKFHEFIANSIKFIDENELLIRDHPEHDSAAIHHMFRNMHTIKGNARTYGLRHLTNTVHEVEQYYEELRKPRPDIAWDQTTLLNKLLEVRDLVEYYAKINDVSLGRKGAGRRAGTDRFLMVDKRQIQDTLHRLETINTGNIHELIAAQNEVRRTLRLLGTEPIIATLEGVFDSLPSLARELGKIPPMIDIQDNGYVIRTQISAMIKNVFMHLVRNSLDHGLETAEERLKKGKLSAGTLRLRLTADEHNQLQIRLSDDGRGLALAQIRKIATEKELIAADAQLSDEDIAKQIFRPGFSTADKITEVSGRGVGMDAVQDLVKRENGKIELQFTDQAIGAEFRQFETIVYLPENLYENANDFDFTSNSSTETNTLSDIGLSKTSESNNPVYKEA